LLVVLFVFLNKLMMMMMMMMMITNKSFVKGNGPGASHSAAYLSHTGAQQHFTILEVTADWHELR